MDFVKPKPPAGHVVHLGVKLRGDAAYHTLSRDTHAWGARRSRLTPSERALRREAYPQVWAFEADDFVDDDHVWYTPEAVDRMLADAYTTLEANLERFAALSRDEFMAAEDDVCREHRHLRLVPDVSGLRKVSGMREIPGVYVLVLEKYCQMYVGQSRSIYDRIRGHWTRSPHLELLSARYGPERARLPIGAFRALDTARVYVLLGHPRWEMSSVEDRYEAEEAIVESIPSHFRLNRDGGGRNPLYDTSWLIGTREGYTDDAREA